MPSFLPHSATRNGLLFKAGLIFAVFAIASASLAAGLPQSEADAASYSITLPIHPDYVDQVRWSDTWGAPRSGGRSHIGVDMMGPKMIPLVAAADSTVTWGRFNNEDGSIVRLRDAQGWEYQYIHINNDTPGSDDGSATCLQTFSAKLCDAIDSSGKIQRGTAVSAGEFIGYMGDAGNAERTAPHLHFEVYAPTGSGSVVPVNPTPYVDAAKSGIGVEQERVGPFLNVTVAADEMYRRLEGRSAGTGEKASVRDAVSRGGLKTALAEIAESNPSAAMLDRLYLAFFLRVPDADGWEHWIDKRADGHRLEDIAEWFAESDEFTTRYGSVDFSTFLDQLYQDVLGRASDEQGKTYWLELLDDGDVTRGTIVVYFTESAEMLQVVKGRSELTVIHRALGLDRPDDAEVQAWETLRATTSLEDAIDGMLAED